MGHTLSLWQKIGIPQNLPKKNSSIFEGYIWYLAISWSINVLKKQPTFSKIKLLSTNT